MAGPRITRMLVIVGVLGWLGVELYWPPPLAAVEDHRWLVAGLFAALAGIGIGRSTLGRERRGLRRF